MKKSILVWLSTFTFATAAFAAQKEFGNINEGNIEAGGSIAYQHLAYEGGSTGSFFSLNAPIRYFNMDRVSLGLNFSVSAGSGDYSTLAVGPSAAYYFWTQERLAAFAEGAFGYNKGNDVPYFFDLDAGLGMKYFITQSVGFGPVFTYSHGFGREWLRSYDMFTIRAAFSIYL